MQLLKKYKNKMLIFNFLNKIYFPMLTFVIICIFDFKLFDYEIAISNFYIITENDYLWRIPCD